ncbi:MAG: hypothetical protein Q9222_005149 [Ikaeria aurantiellina]
MAPSMPLNAEPSKPNGIQDQHLPPKSYSDATKQQVPNTPNGVDDHNPTQFVGQGEADVQRSPPFSQPRHRKSGSLRMNGAPKESKAPDLIVEDFQDKDGERLTSLKLAFDDRPHPQRRQTELVSGRKAGAGWGRSQ